MRQETRAESLRAFALSVGVHIALFALLFIALRQSHEQIQRDAAIGNAVSAELVTAGDLSAAVAVAAAGAAADAAKTEKEKTEKLEQVQEQEQEQEPQPAPVVNTKPEIKKPVPKPVVTAKPEIKKPEPKPVVNTKPEIKKPEPKPKPQQTAAQKAAAEREAKLAAIRAQRAGNAGSTGSAADRLAAIRAARAGAGGDASATAGPSGGKTSSAGNDGTDTALASRYAAAIARKINQNWSNRPDSVKAGMRCRLTITQTAGGKVTGVSVGSPCAYDEAGKASIVNAVKKASPLPYAGFESVFKASFPTNFQAQ